MFPPLPPKRLTAERRHISGPTHWPDHANNTLLFWDGLIEHFRFPFLKTALPRYNSPWHDSMANLSEFIEQRTDYPYALIESNLDRLGLGSRAWAKPTGS